VHNFTLLATQFGGIGRSACFGDAAPPGKDRGISGIFKSLIRHGKNDHEKSLIPSDKGSLLARRSREQTHVFGTLCFQ
jgi:hypothetical protein